MGSEMDMALDAYSDWLPALTLLVCAAWLFVGMLIMKGESADDGS